MVISISDRSVGNDRLLRNQNRLLLLNDRRDDFHRRIPRQRQTHHGRVDLILDLERDVRLNRALIDSVRVAPTENLFLCKVRIRSEAISRRSEAARAVAGAAVGLLGVSAAGGFGAVAPPVGGDYDIGVGAFNRLGEKALDEPEDGHGSIG